MIDWEFVGITAFNIILGVLWLVLRVIVFAGNYIVYKEIFRYEIPRETGLRLWWTMAFGTREQLFDLCNVSHKTRKSIIFVEDMMTLPPEARRRVMKALEQKDDEQ